MCIICLEFQRRKDIADARLMVESARREPSSIDKDHLEDVEDMLAKAEADAKANP